MAWVLIALYGHQTLSDMMSDIERVGISPCSVEENFSVVVLSVSLQGQRDLHPLIIKPN